MRNFKSGEQLLEGKYLIGTVEGIMRASTIPWPYINYLIYILKSAYREFEERAGALTTARGAKTSMVLDAIERSPDSFRMVDLGRVAPHVTREMIRVVLNRLKKDKKVYCDGYEAAAVWRKGSKEPLIRI
jgi:hypothetical protein